MNKYEERAQAGRKAGLRSSMTIWTGGLALVAAACVIAGLATNAPREFWSRAAIVLAVLMLIFRQIGRRLKGRSPRAAEPDPQSKLDLS